jgi:hypothetical protein
VKSVIVAGDLLWENSLVEAGGPREHNDRRPPHAAVHRQPGGAWFLETLLKSACPDVEVEITAPAPSDAAGQAYSLWSLQDQFPGSKTKVWRVSRFLGHAGAPTWSSIPKDAADPDLLVLDDLNMGFRDDPTSWPLALQAGGAPRNIILKTTVPLGSGALHAKLLADFADRLDVVVPVSALRYRRASISKALSWDRTIEETAREFDTGISSTDLGRVRRVVVHFGASGVASFTRGGRLERFLYHPEDLEGVFESGRPGMVPGATSVFVAALARHVAEPASCPLYIALGRALAARRAQHEAGGGPAECFSGAAGERAIREALHPPAGSPEPARIFYTTPAHRLLDDLALRDQPDTASDLLRDLTGTGFEHVAAKAADVVLRGPAVALAPAPRAQYGQYLTVDRQEIERINAIRGLIHSYRENGNDRRPLSIAVFGPPGSGKSFAIRQLAEELPGNSAILEFNLSQFESIADLHLAFQRVRDESVRGGIPLVFWDEFDCGDLRWLKEFLAPMQDAEFRSGGSAFPIGRAVFVFAGGTSHFEAFDRTGAARDGDRFRIAKGPDFVSRLRGFVNIKGPNPTNPTGTSDEQARAADLAHLIRRAIVLRTAIERFHPQLIDSRTGLAAIASGVLGAFLRAKKYIHGARSLEAVVMMSNLSRATHFGVAELPSPDVLGLHVTTDFLEHARDGQLEFSMIEALASEMHERWRKEREGLGWTYGPLRDDSAKRHPLLRAYSELPDAEKEHNRLTARLGAAKLHALGYRIVRRAAAEEPSGEGEQPERPALREDEVVRLMKMEHDIWLRERLLRGFEWAAETDDRLRLHRCVQRFDDLPVADRRLDRKAVETALDALWKHGFTLAARG